MNRTSGLTADCQVAGHRRHGYYGINAECVEVAVKVTVQVSTTGAGGKRAPDADDGW